MKRTSSELDRLANNWVAELAQLSPSFATYVGIPGGEDRLDDHSPEHEARYHQARKTLLEKLSKISPVDAVDEVTLDALTADLELSSEIYEAGLYRRDLNVIASPAQGIRDIFDLSPTSTEQDWVNLDSRMRQVSNALSGYRESLREGIAAGDTPARRQVERVIEQVAQITAEDGFFLKFAATAKSGSGELSSALQASLAQAAQQATDSYADFGAFLRDELLAKASEVDAIGRERYALLSQTFLGAKVDLDDTYEWGIAELAKVIEEQEKVADQIKPGATILEAIAELERDPKRKLHGTDALQAWMQQLSDQAVEKLSGTHFDIAEPLKRLECLIAPTQHGGIYYTGPTDDFSRPGRMWWSVPPGVTEFDTWRETTTVYHEGVPGHHLQIAQAVYNRDELNDWRRHASFTSGHAEGWALYAERLMADLGFLDDPGDRLGMLDGQRMRAARVVLDIGVHTAKPKLSGSGTWDFDYALKFMTENMNMPAEFVNFEVHRYFGWPGQAPSYKIGQRIWEQIRDETKARMGASFDIREFHKRALNLGGLGLDSLRRALSR